MTFINYKNIINKSMFYFFVFLFNHQHSRKTSLNSDGPKKFNLE
jgi:hypothetical protein